MAPDIRVSFPSNDLWLNFRHGKLVALGERAQVVDRVRVTQRGSNNEVVFLFALDREAEQAAIP
jgi:hypothetical protein